MNEDKIQDLLKSLFNLKYNWTSGQSIYTSEVVRKEGRIVLEQVIRSFLLDNRDEQNAALKAKVFVYEEIIKKSTFAPLLGDTSSIDINKDNEN